MSILQTAIIVKYTFIAPVFTKVFIFNICTLNLKLEVLKKTHMPSQSRCNFLFSFLRICALLPGYIATNFVEYIVNRIRKEYMTLLIKATLLCTSAGVHGTFCPGAS